MYKYVLKKYTCHYFCVPLENVNLENMTDEGEKRKIEAIINNFGQTPTKLFNVCSNHTHNCRHSNMVTCREIVEIYYALLCCLYSLPVAIGTACKEVELGAGQEEPQ